MLIPKNKHAIIKLCKKILTVQGDVTESHLEQLRSMIHSHLESGMSPAEIRDHYHLNYTDFGMFIKKCLELKTLRDAAINLAEKSGRRVTDEKILYYKACQFNFDPYSMPNIPNYHLLLERGVYHPLTNPSGMCRDHMVSVAYGWRYNIPSEIISHPCNCQYLSNIDNLSKNDKSSMTIEELKERIASQDMSPIINQAVLLPKSQEHKDKISRTNSLYRMVTNGSQNLRILKSSPIPENYHPGMTRRSKMVPRAGLEPARR